MADRYRDTPFPADDYDRRYDRAPSNQQPAAEGDPLAELARLIGQADPFGQDRNAAPVRRNGNGYDDHGHDQDHRGYQPEPDRPSWMQNVRPTAPSYSDDGYHDQQHYGRPQQPSFDQYSRDQAYTDPHYRAAPQSEARGERYDDVLFGAPKREERRDDYQAYDDQAPPPYDDAEHYDEAPAPKRRGGTMTVVVVLALAVLGTAGAYAFRTFGGSSRSGQPIVVTADKGPNKIVPANSSGDGKQIYDRIGDKGGERMVSREEQPVNVTATNAPRVVFPPLSQNANPPQPSSVTTATRPTGAGAGNGTVGEEPRKIKTLSIRPDQADAAPAQNPSASAPAPRAQRVTAPSNTAAVVSPPSNGNGPMSLSPQSQSAPPEPRQRVSAVNPSASVSSGGSGSFVQVSSQKTEADAQASFRALQSKYPGNLGSRQAAIRRADLGDKGVFYRAMVGPFGNTDEATQFCVDLKAAGGQCIVQRN